MGKRHNIPGTRSRERNTIGNNQTDFWSHNQLKVSIRSMLPIHRNEQGGGSKEATGRPENKKPSGKIKAVKDAREQHYDPTCEHKFKGRNEPRSARWEEHLEDPIGALDKALKCVENQYYNSRPKILWGRCFLQ